MKRYLVIVLALMLSGCGQDTIMDTRTQVQKDADRKADQEKKAQRDRDKADKNKTTPPAVVEPAPTSLPPVIVPAPSPNNP